MKKQNFLILAFMLILSGTSFAQKGSWYIGGQTGFNSHTDKTTFDGESSSKSKSKTWSFSPEVGTFLKDNLSLGLALNINGNSSDDAKETVFSPVLYMRRFFKVTDKLSPYVGIAVNFASGSGTENIGKSYEADYDVTGFGAHLTAGIAYAISDRFTVVGQYGLFGYDSTTKKGDGYSVKNSDFGLSANTLGPVFNVGIYYTLCK